MKHLGLFEGIGGFSLAARWMNWETVAWCEINPFCQKVLKHHFPEADSLTDIKQTDFKPYANRIDILTGGFPCQPYSVAGQRKGTEDDRHLWPEMLRAIKEIEPIWIVGENVRGIVSWNDGMVFEQVQIDLENEGYEIMPFILPACAVNAPHRRERVWFVAYSDQKQRKRKIERVGTKSDDGSENTPTADSENNRCEPKSRRGGDWPERRLLQKGKSERGESIRSSENATYPNEQHGNLSGFRAGKSSQQQATEIFRNNATNAYSNIGRKRRLHAEGSEAAKRHTRSFHSWNERTTWENFPTESPVCSGDDGVSRELDGITFSKWRGESIKAYGNAIVPQVALQIFKSIEQYNFLNPLP